MESAFVETLRTLRDIKGVQGSFVLLADNGRVLGRDLPALLNDAILNDVGPRLDRLFSLVESDPPTESIALRFGDQRLDIRTTGAARLCVLSESDISQPALRMAMKLVCKKLETQTFPTPAMPPPPAAPPSAPPSAPRLYRGSRVST